MTDYILLHEDEVLGALDEAESCPDCAGGVGIHVELTTGDIWGVTVHSVPCRHGRPGLRLVPPGDAA